MQLQPTIFTRTPSGFPRPAGAAQYPFVALDDAIVRSGPLFDYDPTRQTVVGPPLAAVELFGGASLITQSGTPTLVTAGGNQALQVANANVRAPGFLLPAVSTIIYVLAFGTIANNGYAIQVPGANSFINFASSGTQAQMQWPSTGLSVPGVTLAANTRMLHRQRFGAARATQLFFDGVGFTGTAGPTGGYVSTQPWTVASDSAGSQLGILRSIVWGRDMLATPEDAALLHEVEKQIRLKYGTAAYPANVP